MEMENEELYATSDGFYYEGSPAQGSYTSSSTKYESSLFEQNGKITLNQIEKTLGIAQVLVMILTIICIIRGMSYSKNSKKIIDEDNVFKDINTKKKHINPYYIFSIVLLVVFGIVNIIKGFIV